MDYPMPSDTPPVRRSYARNPGGPGTLSRDVLAILAKFRAQHGWQPGWEWNPYKACYEPPKRGQ